MINFQDSLNLVINSPLDSKACNYYREGAFFKIEPIAKYLLRLEHIWRTPGSIITILKPKIGHTPPEDLDGIYSYDITAFHTPIDNFLANYDIKYYQFLEGIEDIHFKEILFGYTYVAYASDNLGTDFSLTPNNSSEYIGILTSDYRIDTLQASNFTNLWFRPTIIDPAQVDWDIDIPGDPRTILNKPEIPTATPQVQTDWSINIPGDLRTILNKPTVVQPVQSNWNTTNQFDLSYIWNKPGPTVPGTPTNSIQFNKLGEFAGSDNFIFLESTARVYILPASPGASSGILFTPSTGGPQIWAIEDGTLYGITNYTEDGKLLISSDRISVGDIDSPSDTFVSIKDVKLSTSTNTLLVRNGLGESTFLIKNDGSVLMPEITENSQNYVLNFNPITGNVTYGVREGAITIVTDTLSGLMANGGDSSSLPTIELDQNDNKLISSTAEDTDYIGFFDVSEGVQSKTLFSNLPGWNLYLNSTLQEPIKPSNSLNFADGSNIAFSYDASTNTISAEASTASPLDLSIDDVLKESGVGHLKLVAGTKITITYDVDGRIVFDVQAPDAPLTEQSVQGDGTTLNKIKLINDSSAPGNNKYYGTSAIGIKGFFGLPTQTVFTQQSIIGNGTSGNELSLVNDISSPGNTKYYGTNSSGIKGYHDVLVPNITSQYSVQGDGSIGNPIQLTGDTVAPGSEYYYGTNSIGVRGFYTLPTTQELAFTDLTDVIPENYILKANHVPIVVPTEDALDLIDTEEILTEVATFTLLADCPADYTGWAGASIRVNGAGTGLEFYYP